MTNNLPSFPDVLRVLLGDLAVEKFIVASETQQVSPRRYAEILTLLAGVPHEAVPHAEFKVLARDARAAIRTGDIIPYSNIILVSGVTYS